jgi:hypothetical protein
MHLHGDALAAPLDRGDADKPAGVNVAPIGLGDQNQTALGATLIVSVPPLAVWTLSVRNFVASISAPLAASPRSWTDISVLRTCCACAGAVRARASKDAAAAKRDLASRDVDIWISFPPKA